MTNPLEPIRVWWSHEFTRRRWGNNPFQMYFVCMLLVYSVLQLVFGAQGVFDNQLGGLSAMSIAATNTVGSMAAVYGLHLREFDRSVKVEAWGYLSMLFVMTLYCVLLIVNNPFPYTANELGFGEAFVLASIHRTTQIFRYFRAKKRGDHLAIWAMLGKLEPDGEMP